MVGGRYRRVFLDGSPSYSQEEDISTPKEWPEAPIAALRRAMQVLGTLYMIEIGNEARYTLGWLRDPYAYNDKDLREYLSICQEERYKIYGRPAKVDQQSPSDSTNDSPGGLPGGDLPGNSSSDKRSEYSSAASEPEKLNDQSQTTIQECGLGPGPKRGCCSPI